MSSIFPSPSAAPLKPCDICRHESCIVIPSIASQQHLCLLHYYTTGTYRRRPQSATFTASSIAAKKKSSSLLIESHRVDKQLPKVQELFAEAFTDLQKDIGEEAARSFQSAADADDPLALLLDSSAPAASHSAISRSFRRPMPGKRRTHNLSNKKNSANEDLEGGFLREAVVPERIRKLQNPSFPSTYNKKPTNLTRKQSVARSYAAATKKPSNPYRRKQNPPVNVWNQVLDNDISNSSKTKVKTRWEDMEKAMISNITSGSNASTKTCTCGSTKVEIDGNVTSRNNAMTKGEVWGMKDRAEMVVERCHCLACGKAWNEEK